MPLRPLPSARTMYAAFARGDASYDGVFLTGVRTTGIFCRPSCRCEEAAPENVSFFQTPGEALFAGYRACKRCRPLLAAGSHPGWAGAAAAHGGRARRGAPHRQGAQSHADRSRARAAIFPGALRHDVPGLFQEPPPRRGALATAARSDARRRGGRLGLRVAVRLPRRVLEGLRRAPGQGGARGRDRGRLPRHAARADDRGHARRQAVPVGVHDAPHDRGAARDAAPPAARGVRAGRGPLLQRLERRAARVLRGPARGVHAAARSAGHAVRRRRCGPSS
jgi:hypothetical protein